MASNIAVLMGGSSFERAISIKTGQVIVNALNEAGFSALPLDADENLVPTLIAEKPDACYIALHGKGGEDGTLAALLEFLGIPYVGSNPEAARLTSYKPSIPFMLQDASPCIRWPEQLTLPESAFRALGAAYALSKVAKRLGGYPLAVKPARGGSALGMTKVTREAQLGDAVMEALAFDDEVLFQKWIDGREVSCVVLPDIKRVFTPIEIVPKEGSLYDADARLVGGRTTFKPFAAEENIIDRVKNAALEVAHTYDTEGIVRVDMVERDGLVYVLDLKVSPGFAKTSLVLKALHASGVHVKDIIKPLVDSAIARNKA